MKFIKNLIIQTIGNMLLAISVSHFILPNNILGGGLSGIAVLFKDFLPISQDGFILIMSIFFLIIAYFFLSKQLFLNTIYSSITYPIFVMIFTKYIPVVKVEPLLAAIYGGLIAGCGIGLLFRKNSSTGGMDIPPLILKKYFNIDENKGVLFFDSIIVILGILIYDLQAILTGLITVYTSTIAIKQAINFGSEPSKEIKIISCKYKEIQEKIHLLDRGTTVFKANGGFSNEEKEVLMVVVSAKQQPLIIDIIHEIDSRAFIVVTDTHSVHGEGFTYHPLI